MSSAEYFKGHGFDSHQHLFFCFSIFCIDETYRMAVIISTTNTGVLCASKKLPILITQ